MSEGMEETWDVYCEHKEAKHFKLSLFFFSLSFSFSPQTQLLLFYGVDREKLVSC